MFKAEANENKVNIVMTGDMESIAADLTKVIRCVIRSLHEKLCDEDVEIFELMILSAMLDGVSFEKSKEEMDAMLKRAKEVRADVCAMREADEAIERIKEISKDVPKEVIAKIINALKGE